MKIEDKLLTPTEWARETKKMPLSTARNLTKKLRKKAEKNGGIFGYHYEGINRGITLLNYDQWLIVVDEYYRTRIYLKKAGENE